MDDERPRTRLAIAALNGARTRPAELMSIDGIDDFGPDEQTRAVMAGDGE